MNKIPLYGLPIVIISTIILYFINIYVYFLPFEVILTIGYWNAFMVLLLSLARDIEKKKELKEQMIRECIKVDCKDCKARNNCQFNIFMNHCIELTIDAFHPLENNLKTMKYSELLIMLGYALGMLKELGLEQEFLTKFPKSFREGVIKYLDSLKVEEEEQEK